MKDFPANLGLDILETACTLVPPRNCEFVAFA